MTTCRVLPHTSPSRYAQQSAFKRACILCLLALLFSLGGWLMETVLFFIKRGEFVDRGLLMLPLCPVYGLSLLLLYALLRTPQSGFWKKLYSYPASKTGRVATVAFGLLLYAAAATLLCTVTEYATGAFFHRKFGTRLWSYTGNEDNLNGYVCLTHSLLWGVLATAIMGGAWYPLGNLLARANTKLLAVLALSFAALTLADFVFQLVYLWKTGHRFLPFLSVYATYRQVP